MAASNDPQSGSSPSFDWKAFSQKTWVVIVAGLALPPVGMILAWLKQDWMHRTKWIAIGAFGLLLIGRMQAARDSGLRDGSESSDPPIEMQTVDETSADFAEGYRIAMESKAMTPEERGRFLIFTVEPQIPSKADPAAFRRGMGKAFRENNSNATAESSLSEQKQSSGKVPDEAAEVQKEWELGAEIGANMASQGFPQKWRREKAESFWDDVRRGEEHLKRLEKLGRDDPEARFFVRKVRARYDGYMSTCECEDVR